MTMARAIDVFKDFPKDKYNPLIPVITISQLSPLHKVAVNVVSISPDVGEQDVYDMKGMRALAKKGLMKILAATNGQVVDLKKVSPSSCEKCLEMARATGKPSACPSCPNKNDVAYEATVSIPDPAGGSRLFKGTREFICVDEKEKMTEAQYKQAFPFRGAITESKALNRAIRGALMIKQAYKPEELQKPFAVPIVVPDATDPDMKAAILERYRRGTDALYSGGMQQQALQSGEETAIAGEDDTLDAAIDAEFNVPAELAGSAFPICDECQVEIIAFETPNGKKWGVEEWIAFSKKQFNAQLCPKCASPRAKAKEVA